MSRGDVSFIGLGAMGFGMAAHLAKQSYNIRGFDLSETILDKFRQAGGQTAKTPAEAVRESPYCVCMVANAQQVEAALFQGDASAAKALPHGATLLICSTVAASFIEEVEQRLKDEGRPDVHLVDCPVSGGTGRAANGSLSIMADGNPAAIEKAKFLLQEMSDPAKLYLVKSEATQRKSSVGMGSNMKMCHQVLAACHILACSEVMGFASRLGLGPQTAGAALVQSEAWSWMLENRLPRILDPKQPLSSAVSIITKDAGIITSQGRLLGFPTPMCSLAEQVYLQGLSRGWAGDDDSSLARLYAEGAEHLAAFKGQVTEDDKKIELVVKLLKGIHLCATAETLCFGARVGLDLNQLQELCNAAAGGSLVFERESGAIIEKLRENAVSGGWTAHGSSARLVDVARDLQEAVDEAQRLKCPLHLGNAALSLVQMTVLRISRSSESSDKSENMAAGSIAMLWSSA